MRKSEMYRRADWLRIAECRACELNPKLHGRMDWDTAIYLFNTGIDSMTRDAGSRAGTETRHFMGEGDDESTRRRDPSGRRSN